MTTPRFPLTRTMDMPRVAVFGAGSIGCYLGGRLVQGGADVRLIGRARLRDAVASHGLRVSRTGESPQAVGPVDFATSEAALEGSRVVALCVKSQDTAEAAAAIAAHAPDAWVISFQNGVSNMPVLRGSLARVSGAVVPFNVTSPEPALFHQGTDGALMVGPEAPDALVEPLRAAGVAVRVVADIDSYLWAKLLVNLNNALNTLSGGPLRDGLLQRGYRAVLTAMMEEGLAVARASGVEPATFNGRTPAQLIKLMRKPDWLYGFLMDRVARIDRTARSSMLDDLELGRSSELDYLQGEIVRRGRTLGVPTPVNAAVMEAVQATFAAQITPLMSGRQMAARFLPEATKKRP